MKICQATFFYTKNSQEELMRELTMNRFNKSITFSKMLSIPVPYQTCFMFT